MTDKLQDLILPKASFILKRMEEEDSIYYECRDCKAYLFDDLLCIKHKPSNILVNVFVNSILSYRENSEHV